MSATDGFGYLLVHFVEDPDGYGEQVYFSLSDGDDPCAWVRLNGGAPLLRSTVGTTGIRDPFVVRGPDAFYIVATDLRIYGGDDAGWDAWTRHGSRSILVWRSTDLVTWSEPWALEVAPPEAGMAWAPEAVYDPDRGEFLLFWSSALYEPDDVEHRGDSYSRVLAAWTPDLRRLGDTQVLIDRGTGVIDTTILVEDGIVHRISKEESFAPGSLRVYHETGPALLSGGYRTVATRIGADAHDRLEAPVLFRDHHDDVWYLFVDQYSRRPQGYVGYRTTDLTSGRWEPIPTDTFRMPPDTKHGGVLPLCGDEWARLRAAYPA
ncbi:glycoside hydrolase family 43 protein [Cellulomonas fengjieae]|uniref:Glycoside hydrolase family 43 protein n=1 Tax=Cellulomonas fengjieae TaxID=2819978 RepID=A0ABS3SBL5_9CELL|nr:glycoside hydrolase family 43 protein [Cellulomonas fengjieae]MBO3083140.1 glycoside hydrolase family 43 protein [Cellulomonas fengjieae]QVI65496.1 glycoside hydrolase family 43 protein [Cellulomonas fengjieae]